MRREASRIELLLMRIREDLLNLPRMRQQPRLPLSRSCSRLKGKQKAAQQPYPPTLQSGSQNQG